MNPRALPLRILTTILYLLLIGNSAQAVQVDHISSASQVKLKRSIDFAGEALGQSMGWGYEGTGFFASAFGRRWGSLGFGTEMIPSPTGPVRPSLKVETIASLSSDNIVQREIKLSLTKEIHQTGLRSYAAEIDQIQGSAEWIDFGQFKHLGSLEFQPGADFTFSTGFGAGGLTLYQIHNRLYGMATAIPLWRVKGGYTPWPRTFFRVEANDDFSCIGWVDNWDGTRLLAVKNFVAEVESLSFLGWELKTNARWSSFGDGNQQQALDNLVLREVVLRPFALKAGVGGGWMGYRMQQPGYWSPSHFSNYGLRVVASKVFPPRWNVETKLNYGYHQENDRPLENELGAEFHIQYKDRSGWLAELSGNLLMADSGAWWRNDFGIRIEMPL